jgi:DNA-directed RNA polymerase subunit RPC12/RpoP
MPTYHCPSCGAEVKFQSSVSVTCVCPYCRSLIVRQDKNVADFGKMAELPDDISPFQIGTEGVFDGTHFAVIGRVKVGWKDGCWNEWFLHFDDGKDGWLAEAEGFLAVSFEQPYPDALEINFNILPDLGSYLSLEGNDFRVVDTKHTECIGCEGELPKVASKGRQAIAIDLIDRKAGFASIEKDNEAKRLYIGRYVDFDDLRFTNLRELPGWKVSMNAQSAVDENPLNG